MSGAPLLPYAAQNSLTREIRAAAAKAGDAGLLSLWAGQAAPLSREMPAGELVAQILREAEDVIERLSREP
jgi:nitronate monooxygenase